MTISLTAHCNTATMKEAVKIFVDEERWGDIKTGLDAETATNEKTLTSDVPTRTITRYRDALQNIINNSTADKKSRILTGLNSVGITTFGTSEPSSAPLPGNNHG